MFLGNKKYPGENEYKAFLAQHGGRSNASTSMNLTTFKFDIVAKHGQQALDIFANFFVAPLFTASGTEREVQAVDSENSKNLTADVRRRLQILKALADPKHWYSKFSTGNNKTLPTETPEQIDNLRQALLAFHSKHYRPDQLTVVVAGPQSLDELQSWVIPRFAPMKPRSFPATAGNMTPAEQLVEEGAADAPKYSFDQFTELNIPQGNEPEFHSPFKPDFQNGQWPVLITTKPVRSVRRLVLMFPLPPCHLNPDQSPSSVLSHLLGHEGPNSSFAVLQNEGFLTSLSAGPRSTGPDFTLFQIDVNLTEKGEEEWEKVVDALLQHCQLIGRASTSHPEDLKRIWDENAKLRRMFFHQNSPGSVYDLAPRLAASCVKNGTEKALCAGNMLQESAETYPMERVADFASRLVLSNCIVERCSQQAWETARLDNTMVLQTEKWYGVDYYLQHIPVEMLKKWNSSDDSYLNIRNTLALPRPNRYVPRTLELCPDLPDEAKAGPRIEKEIDPPELVVDDPRMGRLWHRLDDRYALPKSIVTILIRNAAVSHVKNDQGIWIPDSMASVHSTLLSGIFGQALAQETYDADLAGLHWNISMTAAGIHISCSGFSDRLPDLALDIVRQFLQADFIKENFFLSTKDRVLRSLKTYFQSRRADSQALYYRDFLLAASDEGIDESLHFAEAATLESTKSYHCSLFGNSESFIECLFTGNVSRTEAQSFFASASDAFQQKSSSLCNPADISTMWIPGGFERKLGRGEDLELHFASKNDQEENGSVLMTFQSHIPGYRGAPLSSNESLKSSSAIRLLCQIIREPLFDELRTKQTLGYIVSSYYDIGFSSSPDGVAALDSATVPVDYIVISILSRKVAPPEVVQRIDEFLTGFRSKLLDMPDSQIQHHADALRTKLLKPIQKLSSESSSRFSKIRRYAPEVLCRITDGQQHTNQSISMPWDDAPLIANTVRDLKRDDLVETWDRMMLPGSRSRVVSCVYGRTHPLPTGRIPGGAGARKVVSSDLAEVAALRREFPVYGKTWPASNASNTKQVSRGFHSAVAWTSSVRQNRVAIWGAALAAVGAASICLLSRSNKKTK